MSDKLPTVKISGKDYVLVKDRIIAFNEMYPYGEIHTELLSKPEDEMVLFKATVYPNGRDDKPLMRHFTGYSQATWGEGYINKTAALENCETSAVGRALAFMGIGVLESVASADEVNKAKSQPAPIFKTNGQKKSEDVGKEDAEMDAGR